MLTLDECGQRLSLAINERAKLNLALWRSDQLIAARQRALTPADGWPGKNDAARAAARDAAYDADTALAAAVLEKNKVQELLIGLDGEIQSVEAERRAGEWRIRQRMIDVLDRGALTENRRGDRVEAVHDDVAQAGVDQALEDELEPGIGLDGVEGPVGEDEADFPF